MEAERGSIKYKQIEYISDRKDEKLEGTITSITEWGLYVEEKKSKAEGLIHINKLGDDFFVYNKNKMALIGTKTKKYYRLGDQISVKIKNIDIANQKIDYELFSL